MLSVFRFRLRPLNSEIVGIFLGNESTPEYVTVPYRRVVVSPGSDFDGETYVETDLVRAYE